MRKRLLRVCRGMIAVTLVGIVVSIGSAGVLDGVGVISDSDSVEYQFTVNDGIYARTTAKSWVEILAEERNWNFGPFTTDDLGSQTLRANSRLFSLGITGTRLSMITKSLPLPLIFVNCIATNFS